jgi:hypothetical protein
MVISCATARARDGSKPCVAVCGDGRAVNPSRAREIARWIFIEPTGGLCIYNVYVYAR